MNKYFIIGFMFLILISGVIGATIITTATDTFETTLTDKGITKNLTIFNVTTDSKTGIATINVNVSEKKGLTMREIVDLKNSMNTLKNNTVKTGLTTVNINPKVTSVVKDVPNEEVLK